MCWTLYVNTNFQDLNVIDMTECNVNECAVKNTKGRRRVESKSRNKNRAKK